MNTRKLILLGFVCLIGSAGMVFGLTCGKGSAAYTCAVTTGQTVVCDQSWDEDKKACVAAVKKCCDKNNEETVDGR